MSKTDWSALDARLLQLLLAVLETGSITAAAARLGVTQSAVSHLLDKLRAITGDPLFVKSGRGIQPTARAQALAEPARELLRQMQQLVQGSHFEPAQWQAELTVAANDFQRDLLLPALAARLRELAPGATLRIVPSGAPSVQLLRSDDCQLVISPRPPEGGDILQRRLFEDRYRVFYDPAVRDAPASRTDYLAAEHATVVYAQDRPLALDAALQQRGIARRFRVMVSGFAALPAFIHGSPLLCTVPGLLGEGLLRGLASAPVPVPCPPIAMYMLWHQRHREDPAHQWMRQQILALAQTIAARDKR